jgi:hypothetical protein
MFVLPSAVTPAIAREICVRPASLTVVNPQRTPAFVENVTIASWSFSPRSAARI